MASRGSRQPSKPRILKEKKKEQTKDEVDQVNPAIGNRLQTKAAPTPTYAVHSMHAQTRGQ